MTASALIDEAIEDLKRDPREKRDVVLQKLIGFYNWCKTEYPRKTRGRAPHKSARALKRQFIKSAWRQREMNRELIRTNLYALIRYCALSACITCLGSYKSVS